MLPMFARTRDAWRVAGPLAGTLLLAFMVQGSPAVERAQQGSKPARKQAAKLASVGAAVPSFRLNNHEGRGVSHKGAKGEWTVVAFYPKAMTPG